VVFILKSRKEGVEVESSEKQLQTVGRRGKD